MIRLLVLCSLGLAPALAGALPIYTGQMLPSSGAPNPLEELGKMPDPAGTVALAEGGVHVIDKDEHARSVKQGDPVYAGERIETDAGGEVQMSMQDGAYVGVRPGSKLKISEYRAQGDDDDKAVLELVEGSIRAVSGWIAQLHDHYLIKTASITVGVRGTDFEVTAVPPGSSLGDAGDYVKVNIGRTYIQSAAGRVDVTPGHAGFAPRGGRLRPRLLARVPRFFRATRNEGRFKGLQARIHARLAERRAERRRFVQERRERLGARRERLGERRGMDQGARQAPGAAAGARQGTGGQLRQDRRRDLRQGLRRDVRQGARQGMRQGARQGLRQGARQGRRGRDSGPVRRGLRRD